jgi:hypothetical protein
MKKIEWEYVSRIASRLALGVVIPKQMETQDFLPVLDWLRSRFFRKAFAPLDRRYTQSPFWRRQKVKHLIYQEALDEAWIDILRAKTDGLKEGMRQRKEQIGMRASVDSPEAQDAYSRMKVVEKMPYYEGQHRDIVKLALKAGMPVPSRVLADYVDEPWAAAEMLRRSKQLGVEYFGSNLRTEPDPKSLSPSEYPSLRELLTLRRGKPFLIYVLLQEHALFSSTLGARALIIQEVFLSLAGARQSAASLGGQGSEQFYLRTVSLQIENDKLSACYLDCEPEDCVLGSHILFWIESRLASN